MYHQIEIEKLFYSVSTETLKVNINETEKVINRYAYLHNGSDFLGVKPKNNAKGNEVFYLENKTAYDLAQYLADEIVQAPTYTIAYQKKYLNGAIVFIGEIDPNIVIPEVKHKQVVSRYIDLLEQTKEEEYLKILTELKSAGFTPSIVVENGFDYLDKVVFYLMVEVPASEDEMGYLNIGRYKFGSSAQKSVRGCTEGGKYDSLVIDIKENCVPVFRKLLSDFLKKYKALKAIPTNKEEATACILDILDINRDPQSLLSDSEKHDKVLEKVESAQHFFANTSNMGDLLSFLIQTNLLQFTKKKVNKTDMQRILSERNAYANLKRIYAGKNANAKERRQYILSQIQALLAIPGVE